MPRCHTYCVSVDPSWTDRQKWNVICANVAYDDTDNANDNYFNQHYVAWQNWNASHPTHAFEPWLRWKLQYGTDTMGNLPQNKIDNHVGESHAPCPYSTQSIDARSEIMLGSVPAKVDHTANSKIHYMRPAYNGTWGYECTFDNCPYYLANGRRYFFA
jgi:hypothetical protein